jgi:hypothetical protein
MIIAKGSSREIKGLNQHYISLDGVLTQVNTIIKSRITNKFDHYLTTGSFGLMQNKIECDPRNNDYSILIKDNHGFYSLNEIGCLAPIFDFDAEFEWLEMGFVSKLTDFLFTCLTITDTYPDGISFNDFVFSAQKKYREIHGIIHPEDTVYPNQISDSEYEVVITHPWVANFISWMKLVDFETNDLILKNMGIFYNPNTNKGYPVICDFGINRQYWQKYSELMDKHDSITRNNQIFS